MSDKAPLALSMHDIDAFTRLDAFLERRDWDVSIKQTSPRHEWTVRIYDADGIASSSATAAAPTMPAAIHAAIDKAVALIKKRNAAC